MTTTTSTPAQRTSPLSTERADLLESLRTHRRFLLQTVRGLTDEQARTRTTVSALTLGGLVKHVTAAERVWRDFIVGGAAAMVGTDGATSWPEQFVMGPDEALADVVARYEEGARCTDALVASLPDLDAAQALPSAPWFVPDACWSGRRVLLHIVAETAQHAGHADILREALDGARTMG
jgi:uncharacterized damage-inducible protein DinB